MNIKIFNKLEDIFQQSPQLLCDSAALKKVIQTTFKVDVDTVYFREISQLVERIDELVLEKYFSEVWQSKTKKYKYSGLKLIDEVNDLNPKAVLDAGCGFNEFKGKIHNLIGIDPYNAKADVNIKITDYATDQLFDVIICLGSVNFGTTDKIFRELESVMRLSAPGGKLYFRVNPGMQHSQPEAKWITFYPWESTFIVNCANYFNVELLELRDDYNGRLYFVWAKNRFYV
jgi:hypothetical protein